MSSPQKISLHLFLIRHGETEWSLNGRHSGRTDLTLTGHGEDEARELGTHLQNIPFAHVLTSPLKRAQRTCELVKLDTVAENEPDLMEWDYGDYEGRQSSDIHKAYAGWNVFRDGCPHGETTAQVTERADRLIARLRKLEGNVALFSHGQFGSALAVRWIGLPLVEARHFPLATVSLSILSYDPSHPAEPVIAMWNAAANNLFDATHCLSATSMTPARRAIQGCEKEGGEIAS